MGEYPLFDGLEKEMPLARQADPETSHEAAVNVRCAGRSIWRGSEHDSEHQEQTTVSAPEANNQRKSDNYQ